MAFPFIAIFLVAMVMYAIIRKRWLVLSKITVLLDILFVLLMLGIMGMPAQNLEKNNTTESATSGPATSGPTTSGSAISRHAHYRNVTFRVERHLAKMYLNPKIVIKPIDFKSQRNSMWFKFITHNVREVFDPEVIDVQRLSRRVRYRFPTRGAPDWWDAPLHRGRMYYADYSLTGSKLMTVGYIRQGSRDLVYIYWLKR